MKLNEPEERKRLRWGKHIIYNNNNNMIYTHIAGAYTYTFCTFTSYDACLCTTRYFICGLPLLNFPFRLQTFHHPQPVHDEIRFLIPKRVHIIGSGDFQRFLISHVVLHNNNM